jgi:uncharacterized protein (TIGR00375 family)
MRLFSEFHVHSRFAMGCSRNIDLQNNSTWFKVKGLNLSGTGDFTHPLWLEEIRKQLKPSAGYGIYEFNGLNFILSTEVSNVYEQDGKVRKVHHLILAPSFEVVDQINELLAKYGKLESDGRPTLRLNSTEFVESLKSISKEAEIIPAHAWTPYFGIFGSKSGFDSLKECYGDKANEIKAIETGMSSDPEMNWRLSQLDDVQLVSFSDAHSFWPWRVGREATIFETDLDYQKIQSAIRTGAGLAATVEVDPGYGKYHYDGHRGCNVWMEPSMSEKYNNRCPKCRKKLTIGVLNRVEQLADRPIGFKPKGKPNYFTLLPLAELIAGSLKVPSVTARQVLNVYHELLAKFPSEFHILLEAPPEKLYEAIKPKLAELILLNRAAKLRVQPGYDGVYGKLLLDEEKVEQPRFVSQKSLVEFD